MGKIRETSLSSGTTGGRQFFNVTVRASTGRSGQQHGSDSPRSWLRNSRPGTEAEFRERRCFICAAGRFQGFAEFDTGPWQIASHGWEGCVNLLNVAVPKSKRRSCSRCALKPSTAQAGRHWASIMFNLGLGTRVAEISTGEFLSAVPSPGGSSVFGGVSSGGRKCCHNQQ